MELSTEAKNFRYIEENNLSVIRYLAYWRITKLPLKEGEDVSRDGLGRTLSQALHDYKSHVSNSSRQEKLKALKGVQSNG